MLRPVAFDLIDELALVIAALNRVARILDCTVLDETFAQYSAMLVMEHLYGPNQLRKFLKSELDQYLKARGSEEIEELPLYAKVTTVVAKLMKTTPEELPRACRVRRGYGGEPPALWRDR